MRIDLFVTCLVDPMRPEIGFSVPKLPEEAGYDVVVPPAQAYCRQPAYNSGDRPLTHDLIEKTLKGLEQLDYVVIPSGSCDGMICKGCADPFRNDPELADRCKRLIPCVYELTDFLVNVARIEALDSEFHDHVAYHNSCSGLRELGVKTQPRELLRKLPDAQLTEVPAREACCGFGGTFSIKYGDISTAIADGKYANVKVSDADAVVLGDVGCMFNIEGRLHRTGDTHARVLHIA